MRSGTGRARHRPGRHARCQFAGEQLFDLAFYNNLSTAGRLGRPPRRQPDRRRGGRRRADHRRPRPGRTAPVDTIVLLVSSYQGHTLEWVEPGLLPDLATRPTIELARFRITGGVHADRPGAGHPEARRPDGAGSCARSVRAWRSRCRRRGWRSCGRTSADCSGWCRRPRAYRSRCTRGCSSRPADVCCSRSAAEHSGQAPGRWIVRAPGTRSATRGGHRDPPEVTPAAGRPSRRRRRAWPRPRSRSCSATVSCLPAGRSVDVDRAWRGRGSACRRARAWGSGPC